MKQCGFEILDRFLIALHSDLQSIRSRFQNLFYFKSLKVKKIEYFRYESMTCKLQMIFVDSFAPMIYTSPYIMLLMREGGGTVQYIFLTAPNAVNLNKNQIRSNIQSKHMSLVQLHIWCKAQFVKRGTDVTCARAQI